MKYKYLEDMEDRILEMKRIQDQLKWGRNPQRKILDSIQIQGRYNRGGRK